MRTLRLLALLALVGTAFTFTSCEKDDYYTDYVKTENPGIMSPPPTGGGGGNGNGSGGGEGGG